MFDRVVYRSYTNDMGLTTTITAQTWKNMEKREWAAAFSSKEDGGPIAEAQAKAPEEAKAAWFRFFWQVQKNNNHDMGLEIRINRIEQNKHPYGHLRLMGS